MIITRTPFRVSFVGGGSDLPEFYQREEGAVLSTSINKYMYLTIHPYFDQESIHLKYSQNENVKNASEIRHPIFKELLNATRIKGVEISSVADIPSGTGLGSSSAFTVGLHQILSAYENRAVAKTELGRLACETEIEKLKEPIGKQDQYAAAVGGLNLIRFQPSGEVIVESVLMSPANRAELQANLMMFYTGDTREAKSVLKEQSINIQNDSKKFEVQKQMVRQAFEMKKVLESGDLDQVGRILHEGWQLKRTLAKAVSNEKIDRYYDLAVKSGIALGGKLLGAGGGGFLMFYVRPKNREKLREALKDLRPFHFAFDEKGSEVIFNDQYS